MNIYFLDECLGEIENISIDGMWINGTVIPNKNMEKFEDFFKAIVDEESDFLEENYPEKWLDDSNWYVIDDKNRRKEIYLPAVYPDGDINWRWR